MGTTLQERAKMATERVDDFVTGFVTDEENAHASGSYVKPSVVVLRSWLAHNGTMLTKRGKIRGVNRSPKIDNERVPRQDELHRVSYTALHRAALQRS